MISVDTYRAAVAAAALDAGADLVNDHTGGADPALAAAVAEADAGLVVTHLGLRPKQVQDGRTRSPSTRSPSHCSITPPPSRRPACGATRS